MLFRSPRAGGDDRVAQPEAHERLHEHAAPEGIRVAVVERGGGTGHVSVRASTRALNFSSVSANSFSGTDPATMPWRTEHDVLTALRSLGHDVQPLPVHDDLGDIRRAATEFKPHIAFNLLEGFDDVSIFDQNVVSHLELLKLPYTGCNPRGLLLARDKSLSKKLLAYHRVPVPEFEVFRVGRPIRRPKDRKSTRLNSSHIPLSRMPSSA